mmetsp:Transcript_32487/g.71494  ORF Transcript_32487/g.71494 Transcript_32487/m.71494 type:complete len:239 (-) Transcript_32487:225-941(-)
MPGMFLFVLCLLALRSCASLEAPKQRWDLGRFVKTAGFYDALTPSLPFISKLSKYRPKLDPGATIWSSVGENRAGITWGPLDDVVMGGVSKSTLEPGAPFDGTWTGVVSTANNGGFAGIRTKLFKTPFDLSSCAGVVIRLRGDGQRYKLILRDDADWNGIAWSHSLLTRPNKTVEYKIPFALFKPTKFARVLANFRPFDQTQLTGFQLSLSKFEYDGGLNGEFREGGFQLNVESIGTY